MPADVEHSYKRRGAVHLIAALNVLTGVVAGAVFSSAVYSHWVTAASQGKPDRYRD